MQLKKSLSTVVYLIINLFVLTDCALNDDGKLIFAHVVSFSFNPTGCFFYLMFFYKTDFPTR